MRRGVGCNQWKDSDMESASVWIERSDVDEVRIQVVDGSELFLTLDEAASLAELIEESRLETWRRRR